MCTSYPVLGALVSYGPGQQGVYLLLQVAVRLPHDLLVFLNLCGERGEERGEKEDILARTVCF